MNGQDSVLRVTTVEALPLVMTPMDVAAVLKISRNTAYELVHRDSFPSLKIGKQYRIPRDKFINWLDGATAA